MTNHILWGLWMGLAIAWFFGFFGEKNPAAAIGCIIMATLTRQERE